MNVKSQVMTSFMISFVNSLNTQAKKRVCIFYFFLVFFYIYTFSLMFEIKISKQKNM